MLNRPWLLFLLLATTAGHADLRWTATHLFTNATPAEGVATGQFTFTNTGAYPVKVTATHTSCGCTAAVTDGRTVGPGQTGKIDVSFKTLNRRGLFEEAIIVETDDPAAKLNSLSLRIFVGNPVELLPSLLFWQPNEPLTAKVIRITTTEGFTIKSLDATCPNPDITLRLEPIKPGADYKLTVTPKSPHQKATISILPKLEGRSAKPITASVRVS